MTTMTRLIVKLKFLLSIQLCQPLEYLLPMVCQQLKHSPRNYLQPLINILKRKLFLSHILVVVRHLPLISQSGEICDETVTLTINHMSTDDCCSRWTDIYCDCYYHTLSIQTTGKMMAMKGRQCRWFCQWLL